MAGIVLLLFAPAVADVFPVMAFVLVLPDVCLEAFKLCVEALAAAHQFVCLYVEHYGCAATSSPVPLTKASKPTLTKSGSHWLDAVPSHLSAVQTLPSLYTHKCQHFKRAKKEAIILIWNARALHVLSTHARNGCQSFQVNHPGIFGPSCLSKQSVPVIGCMFADVQPTVITL